MATILLMCLVNNDKKYTRFAGNFEDHADVPLRFGAHCRIEHNQGFTWSHGTSPLGNYLHRITPASAMVIDGGDTTNTIKKTFS